MFLLLSGSPPFFANTIEKLAKKTQSARITFDAKNWSKISKEAKELVKLLLSPHPKARPPADLALEHLWFKKTGPFQPFPASFFEEMGQFQRSHCLMGVVNTYLLKQRQLVSLAMKLSSELNEKNTSTQISLSPFISFWPSSLPSRI